MIFLSYFIILFFLIIILKHLFKKDVVEGLSNCSSEEKSQNSLVHKNTGTLKHQQDSINNFKKMAENEIRELTKRIDGFKKTILKNTHQISTNDKTIKAVAKKAMNAAKAKQAKMDKLSM